MPITCIELSLLRRTLYLELANEGGGGSYVRLGRRQLEDGLTEEPALTRNDRLEEALDVGEDVVVETGR